MKLAKENLQKALACMAQDATLLVPGEDGGVRKFVPWHTGAQPDLEMVNTTLPPKDMLFPQTEKMYRYKTEGQDTQVEELAAAEKQVVFGIRPCDVRSIGCMDLVFLTGEFVDSFYARKREELTLVAVACTNADDGCFCTSMGGAPNSAPKADLLLTPTATGWNVAPQTPKGEALAGALGDLLQEGEDTPLPAAQPQLSVDAAGVAQALPALFDHPLWDEAWRSCLGCGTCTYLCPTCYCFEMANVNTGSEGTTLRCWDSCMFSEYSRMAGGHNPRPSKKERVRNRFMHKLTFFEERYGEGLCVGCGRCMDKCPGGGMDIVSIIEMVKEAGVNA